MWKDCLHCSFIRKETTAKHKYNNHNSHQNNNNNNNNHINCNKNHDRCAARSLVISFLPPPGEARKEVMRRQEPSHPAHVGHWRSANGGPSAPRALSHPWGNRAGRAVSPCGTSQREEVLQGCRSV